jgi:alanine dehydrogenase
MGGKMSLVLTASEVMQIMTMDLALAAVTEAFRAHGQGRVNMPPKVHLILPRGSFKAMFGEIFLPAGHICGVKWNSNFSENPRHGGLTIKGKLLLNDPATGLELVDLDATRITNFRTGAAGAIAVQHLARPEATRLGLVGAGEQARTQVAAIRKVRPIATITIHSRTATRAFALRDELEATYGLTVVVVEDVAQAVRDQDIVVTTTPSTSPLVRREWVGPGTHINAVGADSPGKQELDPGILAAAKIVVDDWAQAKDIGEINVPLARGEITPAQIYGTLGEVVAGKKPGRTAPQEITVFDATGLAIQDLALGLAIYHRARELGLGQLKDFLR